MLLIEVESEQLMTSKSVITVGTFCLVQPSVLNFDMSRQVVLTQALLRAQATVVDGLNLEQGDQTLEKGLRREEEVCTWREWWEER